MRTLVIVVTIIVSLGLLGCGGGQMKREPVPSSNTSIQKETGAPKRMDQKGWKFKNRRGSFVFTDGTGAIRGGYLSAAGLAALDKEIPIEIYGDSYFSRLNSYQSYFSQYGRTRPPTLIKMRSDISGNLIVEPLTIEQQKYLHEDMKEYAINQIYFDGEIGDFVARVKDMLIIAPNEPVKIKAYHKVWDCKYFGNGLGEITLDTTALICGQGVSCQ